MPKVKNVTTKSLRDLCISFIGKNMEYWCKYSKNDLLASGQEISRNPFDLLPSAILEEIRWTYWSTTNLSNKEKVCQILQHLITPQLINVSLYEDLLELASVRCKGLKTLQLQGINYLGTFPQFEKLEVVHLSSPFVCDSHLHILGTSCRYLRRLRLGHCPKVTDYGIQGLCVSVNSTGMKDDTLGVCKSIESLILVNCGKGVTKKGIKIALENLPVLKTLNFNHHALTFEVLTEIASNASMDLDKNLLSKLPEFALSVLFISHPAYKIGDLKLVLSMCPSIAMVWIEEPDGFTDIDLLSLISLKKIQKVKIYASPKREVAQSSWIPGKITFDGGVTPLLNVIGSLLTTLEICSFHESDIQSIVENCPNLRGLSLDCNITFLHTCCRKGLEKLVKLQPNNELPKILSKLHKLYLCINVYDPPPILNVSADRSIPHKALISLLSSPLLRELSIVNCDTLTDGVLRSAAKYHNFKNLESLWFQNCDSVTNNGISIFMQEGNVLRELDLSNCNKNVSTESNINYWKNIARKKNWEISFDHLYGLNDGGL